MRQVLCTWAALEAGQRQQLIDSAAMAAFQEATRRDLAVTHRYLIENWEEVLLKARSEIRKQKENENEPRS